VVLTVPIGEVDRRFVAFLTLLLLIRVGDGLVYLSTLQRVDGMIGVSVLVTVAVVVFGYDETLCEPSAMLNVAVV
jgi:hypothetical protein